MFRKIVPQDATSWRPEPGKLSLLGGRFREFIWCCFAYVLMIYWLVMSACNELITLSYFEVKCGWLWNLKMNLNCDWTSTSRWMNFGKFLIDSSGWISKIMDIRILYMVNEYVWTWKFDKSECWKLNDELNWRISKWCLFNDVYLMMLIWWIIVRCWNWKYVCKFVIYEDEFDTMMCWYI